MFGSGPGSARHPVLPEIRSEANNKMPSLVGMDDPTFGPQRVRQLEMRLNQAEQSNRAVLEELMRLQSDYKTSTRRHEQSLEEERNARRQMEQVCQGLLVKMSDIETRLTHADQGLGETKGALAQLVNHTRNVEKAVTTSQQDLMNKKDQSLQRVQELRQELMSNAQTKEQMERIMYGLRDQVMELQNRLESQYLEMNGMRNSVSMQARLAEETARRGMNTQDPSKQHMESRVMELHHGMMEIRQGLEIEIKAREMVENSISSRITDLVGMVNEQTRKREEGTRILDIRQKDLAALTDNERQKLHSRLEQAMDVVQTEAMTRENRIRQDVHEKLVNMEKQVGADRTLIMQEKNHRDDLEKRISSVKKTLEDDMTNLHHKTEKENRNADVKVRELNQATNILDQQIQQMRGQTDKVLAAEIKSRKNSEKQMNGRIDELQDRLRTGMSSMTDAMTALKTNPKDAKTDAKIDMLKVHEISQDKADEVRKSMQKDLKGVDGRLAGIEDKLSRQDKDVNAKFSELGKKPVTAADPDLRSKVESLSFSQDRVKRQVDEMQNDVRRMPREIADLDTRVDRLEKNRSDPNAMSKDQAQKMQNQLDQTQTGVRKLAESVKVVKGVLNDKIQEEATTREGQTNYLRSEVKKVKTQINNMYEE